MLGKLVSKLFGDSSTKFVQKYSPILTKINALESDLSNLSNAELLAKSLELRAKVRAGLELDSVMCDAFAMVRESSKRFLGMRHFDVQILGGIALHLGNIAEMKTGEGKTLVSTLPAYLNSLAGSVHMVSVNDYLTKRDCEWMRPVFEGLGISVGCVVDELTAAEKLTQYKCDITYVNNSTLGFDYLRDNMRNIGDGIFFEGGFQYAIVDEADSILIDEARTPLIISGPSQNNVDVYRKTNIAISGLASECYVVNEEEKSIHLTDIGVDKVEKILKSHGVINDDLYSDKNFNIVNSLNQSLRAKYLFHRDKDYIIKDKRILIIDEFTGRVLDGRRYSEGLHQAIEAKENVPIQQENMTLASVTYQNLFRMYKKLSGMTGTAQTEAQEFKDIYHINVLSIPTNKTVTRIDREDLVFLSRQDKYNYLIQIVQEANAKGQPILLGTASVEASEELSKICKQNKISHEVLNAKNHAKEATIIANSGRSGAVTIATNMAGRGTDIKLGGNFEMMLLQALEENKSGEAEENIRQNLLAKYEEDKQKVLNAGGLLVIGTERHESRRIDDQLRGRSGRQGDPGETIFLLSLEDDLLRIFGGDRIKSIISRLGYKEGEPMDHAMLTKVIRYSQKKIESANYDMRKNLLRYDDILNEQRVFLYAKRAQVVKSTDLMGVFREICHDFTTNLLEISGVMQGQNAMSNQLFINKIEEILGEKSLDGINDFDERFYLPASITEFIFQKTEEKLAKDIAKHDQDSVNSVLGSIFVGSLDEVWRGHLSTMSGIRDGIHLRSYGQKDPLNEYRIESYKNFDHIMHTYNNLVIYRVNVFQLHS